MVDRAAKDALYDRLASVAKAIGNGRRAEIVDVLAQGERSVDEIAGEIGQSVANTSQHLQQLLRAGLVTTRRAGTRTHYSLAGDGVFALWAAVRDVAAAQLAEIDRLAAAYLGDRSELHTITRSELRDRLRRREVVVIDVLRRRLSGVPAGKQVVAYCRGPYCVYADDAVRALRADGRQAARLEDGFPEWATAGLPVDRGPGQ